MIKSNELYAKFSLLNLKQTSFNTWRVRCNSNKLNQSYNATLIVHIDHTIYKQKSYSPKKLLFYLNV